MGIPDSFDPTMMLGTAKNVRDASAPAIPGDSERFPADVLKLDGTSNMGDAPNAIDKPGSDKVDSPAGGIQRQPADVNRFNSSGGL